MSAIGQRVDIPAGTVPPLRSFIRHLWRYRDEFGETVLSGPPGDVFSLVLDDTKESSVAITIATILDGTSEFHGRIQVTMRSPENTIIGFANLHVLHAFIQLVSLQESYPPAREVGLYCMTLLGFRWT